MHQPVDDVPNVRFVRMNTGEDLITELVKVQHNEEEYYQFINPLKIVYIAGDRPGSLMLSLVEWVFPKICAMQEFQIYADDVITIAEPTEQLTDYYYEAILKFSQDEYRINMDDDFTPKRKSSRGESEDSFSEPSEEELEYIKKVLNDIKNGKRSLH